MAIENTFVVSLAYTIVVVDDIFFATIAVAMRVFHVLLGSSCETMTE